MAKPVSPKVKHDDELEALVASQLLDQEDQRRHAPISPIERRQYPRDITNYAFGGADADIIEPGDRGDFSEWGFHVTRRP